MYSLFIAVILLVGIHFSYKYLERRVPNVLEAQSKARYNELVGELVVKNEATPPKEDDVKRKEELDSFLEELKQTPSSQPNAAALS